MKKRIKILVLVAVAVFILWNLVTLLFGRTTSEIVQYGVLEDAFSTTLYLFKDEVVVDSGQSGVLQPTVSDGERVHKGARIGALLLADTDEGALHEFLQIEDRIQRLESREEEAAYTETLRTDEEITTLSLRITEAAQNGDMEQVAALKEALLVAKDEKSAAAGKKEELITRLKSRQTALQEKIGNSIKEVFSPEAGMLLLGTDGLEREMTTEAAEALTPGTLSAFAARVTTASGGCKILYNNEWRGACTIDAGRAAAMKPGQTVTLRFRECGGESRKAKVLSVSGEENGQAVVVFTSDKAPEGLMQGRRAAVDVILSRHEGLRIPKKALIEEGSRQGVRVQTVTEQVFKTVEVAYIGETHIIIEEGKNTELRLYDTVIY